MVRVELADPRAAELLRRHRQRLALGPADQRADRAGAEARAGSAG
ncbi:hypothetical protein ONA70_16500 [Micromonospora yasonensis]|nr:hypothetical protein [Micromonospora yasonensis]MCW3841702.1 hypothetical protein [Micromonospora yasonensis]